MERTVINEYVGRTPNARTSFTTELSREVGYVLLTVFKHTQLRDVSRSGKLFYRTKVVQYRFRNETAAKAWCIEHGYMREFVKRTWCPVHRVLHASVGGLTPIATFLDRNGDCLDRKVWTPVKERKARRRRFKEMLHELRRK